MFIIVDIFFFFGLKKNYLIPTNLQFFFEIIFRFVLNLIEQQLSLKGYIYITFFYYIFLIILFGNFTGLMFLGFAPTSHLIWVINLSISLCLGIFFTGIYNFNLLWLKLFVPSVPLFLYPLMIAIELLSYVIRSFSLAIRLCANILAGHTLVHIISNALTSTYLSINILIIPIFVVIIGILFLELGIAMLQAYVFVILICIYLNDALILVDH